MSAEVLVAGVGNIFLGDDGFGPEVVRHLGAPGAAAPAGAGAAGGLRDSWPAPQL